VAILSAIMIAATSAMLGGCGGPEATSAKISPREKFVQQVITKRCARCHKSAEDEGKIKLTEPSDIIPLINSTQIFDDITLYNRLVMGSPGIKAHQRKEIFPTQAEMDSIRQFVISHHRMKTAPATK